MSAFFFVLPAAPFGPRFGFRRWQPGAANPRACYVYVYVSRERRKWTPLYVGKGTRDRGRAHLRAAIANEGQWKHRPDLKAELLRLHRRDRLELCVVAEGLSEHQAFAVERALIAHWGMRWCGTGPLMNENRGGRSGVTSIVAQRAAATARERGVAERLRVEREAWTEERRAAYRAERVLAAQRAAATRAARMA